MSLFLFVVILELRVTLILMSMLYISNLFHMYEYTYNTYIGETDNGFIIHYNFEGVVSKMATIAVFKVFM